MIQNLSNYQYVVAPALAWIIAQLLKVIVNLAQQKRWDWHLLYQSGRMPSGHSALVTSITVLIANNLGLDSPLFGLAMVMSAVVLYDAMHVRRAVGEQGLVLQRLLKAESNKSQNDSSPTVREGHTPLEVLVGSLLGCIVSLCIILVM